MEIDIAGLQKPERLMGSETREVHECTACLELPEVGFFWTVRCVMDRPHSSYPSSKTLTGLYSRSLSLCPQLGPPLRRLCA